METLQRPAYVCQPIITLIYTRNHRQTKVHSYIQQYYCCKWAFNGNICCCRYLVLRFFLCSYLATNWSVTQISQRLGGVKISLKMLCMCVWVRLSYMVTYEWWHTFEAFSHILLTYFSWCVFVPELWLFFTATAATIFHFDISTKLLSASFQCLAAIKLQQMVLHTLISVWCTKMCIHLKGISISLVRMRVCMCVCCYFCQH